MDYVNDRIPLSRFLDGAYFASGGPATQVISQRIGAVAAWAFCLGKVSPNAVSLLAGGSSLLGAYIYANSGDSPLMMLFCLIVLQLGYGLDCADGQLARASGRSSALGAWLDISIDAVVIMALSAAIFFYCFVNHGDVISAYMVTSSIAAARLLHLYSVPVKRQGEMSRSLIAGTSLARFKSILWFIMDTPVFLLLIVVLQQNITLLLGYLVFMAVVYAAAAVNNGLTLRETTSN